MEKYTRARQIADDKMAHSHCIPDTLGYIHTLNIWNTHCFSTAIMVARTRLNVALYVHCLSCSFFFYATTGRNPPFINLLEKEVTVAKIRPQQTKRRDSQNVLVGHHNNNNNNNNNNRPG